MICHPSEGRPLLRAGFQNTAARLDASLRWHDKRLAQQLLQFVALIHLSDNVATTDKFFSDIELRDGRP